jgi:LysB family phage lysis regulatory protein
MRTNITTALLLLAALAALGWQYNTNIKLSQNLATTQQTAKQRQTIIKALKTQKDQLNTSQQVLAKDLQKNKAAVLKQLNKIRKLENENQEVRDWSTKPIPAAVIGLQQRPSITGGEHYRQFLRDRSPLPLKPNTTEHQ